MGVQEGNAATLTGTDAATTGLTQRLLWAEAMDADAPGYDAWAAAQHTPIPSLQGHGDAIPDRTDDYTAAYRNGRLPAGYAFLEAMYPDGVRREVWEERHATLTGHGPGPLDTHATLLRLRVAALLPIIDPDREHRLEVTADDWHTAGLITAHSQKVRAHAITTQRDATRSQETDRETLRRQARRGAADTDTDMADAAAAKILAGLRRYGPQTGRQLRGSRVGAKWKPYVRDALRALSDAGSITATEDTGSPLTTTWALADDGEER